MKNIFTFLLFAIWGLQLSAQMAPPDSEFSSPTISVGVVVEDLEKSIDFYTNIIGMTKTGEFSVTKEKCTELGLTNSYRLDVTILKLENSERSNEWKLMSLGTKAKHPKQKYMSDDTGMQYITVFVKHLLPVMKRVQENGIKILSGKPSTLDNGNKFILIQDPDGTFIEIIGPE
ncbi:VOC family protein [Maribellus maritimus]|uniref:VOC family protein n=1 Tax=Maribellus maritimus TaxID=2870838 RepID=UPI001EEB3E5E|nr:VOC family protein [Maribellus maritimus]MCG6188375.1 VOC family protein [Maribellus maritimus]